MTSTALTDSSDTIIMRLSKLIDIQARHGRDVSLMGYVTGKPTNRIFLNCNQSGLSIISNAVEERLTRDLSSKRAGMCGDDDKGGCVLTDAFVAHKVKL